MSSSIPSSLNYVVYVSLIPSLFCIIDPRLKLFHFEISTTSVITKLDISRVSKPKLQIKYFVFRLHAAFQVCILKGEN